LYNKPIKAKVMGLEEKKYLLKGLNNLFYSWNGSRLQVYGDIPNTKYAVSAIDIHNMKKIDIETAFKYEIMPYEIKIEIGEKANWDFF
jgi:hypothetical protein